MFIGIRLKKAKYFLDLKYTLTSKNELSETKYNHLIDCLNILKFYNLLNYLNYGQAILLHDIGRFYENNSKTPKFNHANFGYDILKSEFTNNPIVLLPIKYHEEDLKWQKLLFNDVEFLKCSTFNKKKIIKCCKLVRDIDIISNMKNLAKEKCKNSDINEINDKIINNLYNGQIGKKEDIYNEYDEISYILCGLNLLSFRKSFKYIRKHKIIELLIQKQLNMVKNNKKLRDFTIEVYNFLKIEFNL